ncbi:MAG: DNA primase, partial [Chloroflexota bacterium]|nr:DNA primase [Chloroflexota bacterium]
MTNTEAQDIKSRLDIVEVVSRYVPDLQQSGANWKACCPFHAEKTPSFVVNSSKDLWYCYGACATGGDSLSFIQKMESCSFDRALDIAAELAGVERQRYTKANQQTNDEQQRLLAINESTSIFFQNELKTSNGTEAREYLQARGISDESISNWELGFAPQDRRRLLDNLRAKGFSEAEIVSAGVASQYDNGIRILFSNRVIFPTRDSKGRLIGFGARAMGDETPKYLNTPKTELYEKRNTLYGLSKAVTKIRQQKSDNRKAIVVEGYMDVIASHAAGLEETVASNGTAITAEQMNQLTRYSQRIIFALDADEAGAKAALRGVASIMESKPSGFSNAGSPGNIEMMIATLPAGEDPDSLIKTNIQQYKQIIDTAKPILDFL